jgi:hypothetical protein
MKKFHTTVMLANTAPCLALQVGGAVLAAMLLLGYFFDFS